MIFSEFKCNAPNCEDPDDRAAPSATMPDEDTDRIEVFAPQIRGVRVDLDGFRHAGNSMSGIIEV